MTTFESNISLTKKAIEMKNEGGRLLDILKKLNLSKFSFYKYKKIIEAQKDTAVKIHEPVRRKPGPKPGGGVKLSNENRRGAVFIGDLDACARFIKDFT